MNRPSRTVKGYAVNPVTSPQKLEDRIKVTIDSGTGGSFADCSGFVAEGAPHVTNMPLSGIAQVNTYEAGFGGWAVAAGAKERTYRLKYTFDTNGMNQAEIDQLQGAVAGIDMQWEMRTDG